MTTLGSAGDRELWVLEGPAFDVPIFCDPIWADSSKTARHFIVTLAVDPQEPFKTKALARILPYRINPGEDHIIVNEHGLEKLAYKAPGITPSYYLDLSKRITISASASAPESGESFAKEFLRSVSMKTGRSLDELLFLWSIMMQEAFKWLLTKSEPLDMGFAMLVALPLRADWKERISELGGLSEDPMYENMLQVDAENIPELCHDASLKSVNKSGSCSWTIECSMTEPALHLVTSREQRKLKQLGQCNYAVNQQKLLIDRQDSIVESFVAWAARLSEPVGSLYDSGLAGGRCYMPKLAKRVPKPIDGVSDSSVVVWKLPRKNKRHNRQYKSVMLQDMSDVQPKEADVWNSRGSVAGPEDRQTSPIGLLVPYPNEGPL